MKQKAKNIFWNIGKVSLLTALNGCGIASVVMYQIPSVKAKELSSLVDSEVVKENPQLQALIDDYKDTSNYWTKDLTWAQKTGIIGGEILGCCISILLAWGLYKQGKEDKRFDKQLELEERKSDSINKLVDKIMKKGD